MAMSCPTPRSERFEKARGSRGEGFLPGRRHGRLACPVSREIPACCREGKVVRSPRQQGAQQSGARREPCQPCQPGPRRAALCGIRSSACGHGQAVPAEPALPSCPPLPCSFHTATAHHHSYARSGSLGRSSECPSQLTADGRGRLMVEYEQYERPDMTGRSGLRYTYRICNDLAAPVPRRALDANSTVARDNCPYNAPPTVRRRSLFFWGTSTP